MFEVHKSCVITGEVVEVVEQAEELESAECMVPIHEADTAGRGFNYDVFNTELGEYV